MNPNANDVGVLLLAGAAVLGTLAAVLSVFVTRVEFVQDQRRRDSDTEDLRRRLGKLEDRFPRVEG